MKIITLTVNPAIDLHIEAQTLDIGSDNPCKVLSRDSGGKGINVSKALYNYEIDSLCYAVLGHENAKSFKEPLTEMGMNISSSEVEGSVRENINIHYGKQETVLATEGPRVDLNAVLQIEKDLMPKIDEDTYFVFSGRISVASDKVAIIDFLKRVKAKGAKLILDSKSLTLKDILTLTPFLIKPNTEEAEEFIGYKLKDKDLAIHGAYALYRKVLSNVLLTMGEDGAVLVSKDGVFYANCTADREIKSTVGAGDSTIGGFLAGAKLGLNPSDTLKLAISFGTASCYEPGTNPPKKENIDRLYKTVKVEKIV